MTDEYENSYSVSVFRDKETLNVTKEFWKQENGQLGRVGGPTIQKFDPITGNRISAQYYLRNMIHRDEEEGPAVQKWDSDGNLLYEEYAQYGETNRSGNRPACIHYDPKTGEVTRTEFFKNNVEVEPDSSSIDPQP